MKPKRPFSLVKKKMKSGKVIYYYRVTDEGGKVLVQKSTGQTTKTAAENYCISLHKEGKLIPDKKTVFKDFSKNWFIYDKCEYIRQRLDRDFSYSRTYAYIQRLNLEKHILPVFGDDKILDITEKKIESWLFSLKRGGLQNKTVNHCFSTLKVMLREAARQKIINDDPCRFVKPFKIEKKEKGILSKEEFIKLFDPGSMEKLWLKPEYYTANFLAATTGMRLGEVQALKIEYIFPDHIIVCHSWARKYGIKDTKTHDSRKIPIHPVLSALIQEIKKGRTSGFLFSPNEGLTPIYHRTITRALYKALVKIGISEKEREARKISFHGWRHFFNSMMRGKISDHKLRKLTGHKSKNMTELYTHIQSEDLTELRALQENIFSIEQIPADGRIKEVAAHVK